MTIGERETAHRVYKDALNARTEAQKLFGMGSAEHIAADARVDHALSKMPASPSVDEPKWS